MDEFCSKVTQAILALQEELRQDGSEVELLSIEGAEVRIALRGHLCSCPSSALTLFQEVSGFLRERVPEIERVKVAR